MVELWILAFIVTLITELPVVLFGFRQSPLAKCIGVFLLANIATQPALWFVFPRFSPYWLWVVVAECVVVAVELQIYARFLRASYSQRQAFSVAFAANFISTAIWLAIL